MHSSKRPSNANAQNERATQILTRSAQGYIYAETQARTDNLAAILAIDNALIGPCVWYIWAGLLTLSITSHTSRDVYRCRCYISKGLRSVARIDEQIVPVKLGSTRLTAPKSPPPLSSSVAAYTNPGSVTGLPPRLAYPPA